MINVILTDDHQIIRDGISALLEMEETINVVGEASNGNELIALLATTPVDVVLLDINMPEKDGFETTVYLRTYHPDVKIIILTMLNNISYVHRLMAAGALGFILKSAGSEELCGAIKLVAKGLRFVCADIAMLLLDKAQAKELFPSAEQKGDDKEYKDLSKREIEVLSLIAEGYTNAEIANKLFTSKRTIETHRQNILDKTQSRNTANLIKYALKNGIIT
ncbi:response regulator [Pontibacter silvestris]|uniref:Response regulator n=1 Tax=Pontibacter silvestris TaxID=2305183 RepID=A0ABW4X236_9BACT|nr:response regulator transcription factor [Pontibacter silvestris]MCC9135925.1 response regulator transcription factor [Pontibacter silvestris]